MIGPDTELAVVYSLVDLNDPDNDEPHLLESRTLSWNANAEQAHQFIDEYKDSGKKFVVLVRGA